MSDRGGSLSLMAGWRSASDRPPIASPEKWSTMSLSMNALTEYCAIVILPDLCNIYIML